MSLQVKSDRPGQFWGVHGRGAAPCAPPRGFRPAEGVRAAWPSEGGPFTRTPTLRGRTPAQKNGIRYERKVLKELSDRFGTSFRPAQWMRFEDETGERWCQPDGILLRPEGATIFEVKYTFISDAYYQLRQLYSPVVQRAFLPKKINLIVVCRNFDPATPFPEKPFLLRLPSEVESFSGESMGVLSWML